MKIRKLFAFEGAHVVRGCSTERCSTSIHGHSYRVEVVLASDRLDNGHMVVDFGLLKGGVRDVIDAFDHTLVFWADDDPDYLEAAMRHSRRWISLPVSPSAEQLSRVLFLLVERALGQLERRNGESRPSLVELVLHETATGSAICDAMSADDVRLGRIDLGRIVCSPRVLEESSGETMRRIMSSLGAVPEDRSGLFLRLEKACAGDSIPLAEALEGLKWDGSGLIPAIVQDAGSNRVVMLAWCDRVALEETLRTRKACFWSRSRRQLWRKGETSGNELDLQEVQVDCDGDALVFKVTPRGPVCHTGRPDCFYHGLSEDGLVVLVDPP